jgi:hypothetical protein
VRLAATANIATDAVSLLTIFSRRFSPSYVNEKNGVPGSSAGFVSANYRSDAPPRLHDICAATQRHSGCVLQQPSKPSRIHHPVTVG